MKCKLTASLFLMLSSTMLLTTTTSCESLFASMGYVKADRPCHCTHEGECGAGAMARVEHPVTGVVQHTQSKVDKSYLQELLNADYSIHQYLPEEPKRLTWVDDTIHETVSELTPLLSKSEQNGGKRLMPQGVAMRNSENAVYFYIVTDAFERPSELRLRVQYYADDPLNFDRMEFRINGFVYSYKPSAPKRGKDGPRFYWENCDDALTATDRDLVYALAHADWVELRLKGAGGMDHVKMLNEDQIKAFYNILQLYRLMGGKLQ